MNWLTELLTPWLDHTKKPLPNVPGLFRPTTRAEAVERARRLAGPAGAAIRYRLADHQGGRDPHAADCASHWKSPIIGVSYATADCAGFVAWVLGFDRYQPKDFAIYGGWLNCDSIVIDARTIESWFKIVNTPMPGDVIVYPSIDLDHDGDRDRVGHIGLITAVMPSWQRESWGALRVVHCSGGNDRIYKRAIRETTALPWAGAEMYKGRREERWGSMFLRYRRFA